MKTHERTEKCRDVFALLSEYLDLELPADACRDMEAHIADCPPCIAFADSLRRTIYLCRGYKPAELPEPLGRSARAELLAAYLKMRGGTERPSPG